MEHSSEEDAALYRDAHEALPPAARATLLLLLWLIYQQKLEEAKYSLRGDLPERADVLHAAATRVAAKVQAALPQTLWVQPTLAFFRTAALLSNGCYSGDAPPCRARMAAMLAADGLAYPRLRLLATCRAAEEGGDASARDIDPADDGPRLAIHAGKPALLEAELRREHAQDAVNGRPVGAPKPAAGEPQSKALEVYWLVVEGLRPEGERNPMVHCQALVVTSAATAAVRARVRFAAPSPAGDYTLRVHVASSTVVGVALAQEVPFTVQEDDVPELE